jgi:hypothetical protein
VSTRWTNNPLRNAGVFTSHNPTIAQGEIVEPPQPPSVVVSGAAGGRYPGPWRYRKYSKKKEEVAFELQARIPAEQFDKLAALQARLEAEARASTSAYLSSQLEVTRAAREALDAIIEAEEDEEQELLFLASII